MGLIDVIAPIFPSHLTCRGIQHLELFLAAKDSFREKRKGESMWEEEKKGNISLTGDIILIDHPVYKNNGQTSESIPIKIPDA